jgi:hypothetical protein
MPGTAPGATTPVRKTRLCLMLILSARETWSYWIPMCLAAVGLVLAIWLQNFFYLPAILDCSALVLAVLQISTGKARLQRALLAAILLVAFALIVFSVLLWHRDRDLRAFWSDFRRDGGQVGAGGSFVYALDGSLCWDYIGEQDLRAVAETQAGSLRLGCEPPLIWTASELYDQAELDEIQNQAAKGTIPIDELLHGLRPLTIESGEAHTKNTVLVGGPTVNQVSLDVLTRISGLANSRDGLAGMRGLGSGYAFVMADKPGSPHAKNYHAFGWERHEVAEAFPNCRGLHSHGLVKLSAPGRISHLFETKRVTLDPRGREINLTPLRTDYGLVVRIRHRDRDEDSGRDRWRTLLLVMGWRGPGTLAAARATLDPKLVRMMSKAEASQLDKVGPGEACCTELLVRTDGACLPDLATDQAAAPLPNTPRTLANPSVRIVPWPFSEESGRE